MLEAHSVSKLLVSGMMRSGSTLLQRALNAHPKIDVEYQAKTESFVKTKTAYLENIGYDDYHVLCHYNPSPGYYFSSFNSWLKKTNSLTDLVSQGDREISPEICWTGVKEVLVEEFYPGLLEQGVFCLNIIRDPRDVIASMSFGNGYEHTGMQRPILFDIRNWRKSAHFAYQLQSNVNFKNILFEDLIYKKNETLSEIFRWLGVNNVPVEFIEEEIESGCWSGNSSFGSKKAFDESAVGNYRSVLPLSVTKYIEAVCWPEMKHFGYSPKVKDRDRSFIISSYQEPFNIKRNEFNSDYSTSKENVDYELSRLAKNFDEINRGILV